MGRERERESTCSFYYLTLFYFVSIDLCVHRTWMFLVPSVPTSGFLRVSSGFFDSLSVFSLQ